MEGRPLSTQNHAAPTQSLFRSKRTVFLEETLCQLSSDLSTLNGAVAAVAANMQPCMERMLLYEAVGKLREMESIMKYAVSQHPGMRGLADGPLLVGE